MIRRLLLAVSTFATAATLSLAGIASATTAPTPNPIQCGLKAGASLDVNANKLCLQGKTASNSGSGASNPGNPTPQPSGTPGFYAAMGDSVAAGAGLPLSPDASAGDIQCDRTPQAYPNVVAQTLGIPLVFVACTGATAGDIVTQQHVNGPNPSAQLGQAFANGTPRLITITAGANDVQWSNFLNTCLVSDCSTPAASAAASAAMAILQAKLQFVFASIQARSGGVPPRTVITGYFSPFSGSCATRLPQITSMEANQIQQQVANLNQTIVRSMNGFTSFTRFAPVSFSGHDLCSTQPWVQGLTATAPLHPTAEGQAAIARSVISAAR
ncbi:MAG TPA: SGNH/GDSL hydrolase family protein [Candidatus Saccharimonadales bacterium]|nr:SGNH/GDSL hydrolase family protein [Candidatus Saccharimonadales bacterium]